MQTSTIPPMLYNLTIAEIEVLASPLDRAQALTWSNLDINDEHTRDLIRSVACPEAGEMGADLQRLLDPVMKPAPALRRKPRTKSIPEAVLRETRGNIFDLLADQKTAPEALRKESEAVGANEAVVSPDVTVSAPVTKVQEDTRGSEAAPMNPEGEPVPPSDLRVKMPLVANAGARTMNLGARLKALLAGKGTEPPRSR